MYFTFLKLYEPLCLPKAAAIADNLQNNIPQMVPD